MQYYSLEITSKILQYPKELLKEIYLNWAKKNKVEVHIEGMFMCSDRFISEELNKKVRSDRNLKLTDILT